MTNVAATDNVAVAPDGTTTASEINNGSLNAQHSITPPSFTPSASTQYTGSVFLKAGTGNFVQLSFNSGTFTGLGYVNVDLSNGTIVGSGGAVDASSVTPLINGWYRATITATTANTNGASLLLIPITSGSATRNPTFTGDNTTRLVWGMQVEQLQVPSSYIPTSSVFVTRSADVISATSTLSALVGASSGSLLSTTSGLMLTGGGRYIVTRNGSVDIPIRIQSSAFTYRTNSIDRATANLPSGTYTANTVKSAIGWNSAGASIVANKGTVVSASDTFGAATTVYVMNNNGNNSPNGYLLSLFGWVYRLDDSTLKARTR